MALIDKTLFCFCHWGGKNVVHTDGSASYVGGITDSVMVNSSTTYDAFVKTIFDRLGIESSGKVLHFSVKFDKLQLIRLKDQYGVDSLLKFNNDFAHVYVSNFEPQAVAKPMVLIDSTRGSTTEVEALETPCSEERHGSKDHSARIETLETPCSGERHGSKDHSARVETLETPCFEEGHVSMDHSDTIPVTSSSKNVTPPAPSEWGELLLGEGQAFENVRAFKEAVFKFAIAKRFTYKFFDNSAKHMRVRCTVEGCPWVVTAGGKRGTIQVSIKKFTDSHTHSPLDQENFKPKLMSKFIGDIIPNQNLGSPNFIPRKVCEDISKNFAITLSYKQAWCMKQKARVAIEGKLEDSYNLIPLLCNRLTKTMPGTIATWSCTEDNRFKHLFVSYACSVRGFHDGCRPVIFINVYHLGGPCRNTLLAASALDADNGMYPIAYGVITSEKEESWLWFLECLKLVVEDREVVLVSDWNPSLVLAVDKIFGKDNQAHCFHCVQENFRKFIDTNRDFKVQGRGKEIALKYLNDIGYARTMDVYNESLSKMFSFRKELYDWVIANGPEHWSNALFKKPRWDCLSSNAAESFDSLLGEVTLMQIPEVMEAYHEKLLQLLQNRRSEIGNWKLPVGPQIEQKVLENQKLGHTILASIQSDIEVELQGRHGSEELVNLNLSTCTCLEWQMTGIPCPHACHEIELSNLDIYQCVAGWYKREMQERIYAEVIHDVPTIDITHPNMVGIAGAQEVEYGHTSENNVVLSPHPPQNKRSRGRPRREQSEPQVSHVKRTHCSLCTGVGHNRKTCKESL